MGMMGEYEGPRLIELMVAALHKQAALLALLSGPATITLHVNAENVQRPVIVEIRCKV